MAGCNREPGGSVKVESVPVEPASVVTAEDSVQDFQPEDVSSITPDVTKDDSESTVSLSSEDATFSEPGNASLSYVEPDSDVETAPETAESELELEAIEEISNAYRLWLPTSQGPVLIGLDVLVEGVPLRDVFDQRMQSLGETLGDSVQWEDLISHVAENPVVFGQNSNRVQGQAKSLIKRYDQNKNGVVDAGELSQFVFRDSRFSNEFRLFGTDAFRWSNRSDSSLFQAMDRNDDQKLDRSEINVASQSLLRSLDQNADDCIDLTESLEEPDPRLKPWQPGRSNRQGNVAMDLSGFVSWSNLSYAMGGMLKHKPVFSGSNPVVAVDSDRDGWISESEAEQILKLPVAIGITVDFDSSGLSTIDCVTHDPSTRLADQDGDRVWISHEALTLGIIARDTRTPQNRIPQEAFDQIDANKDGGIDESELPDGAEDQISFETLDVDQDGKLSFEEINAKPKSDESIWNVQVRARAAEHPDGVFGWLDEDHDQFLSSREVANAAERLSGLLAGRESIRPREIPDVALLQFGRGEPGQDDTRFRIERTMSTDKDPRPNWAVQMDANLDGDISQFEFPGPTETFDRLDGDGDRFLDVNEILSADSGSLD